MRIAFAALLLTAMALAATKPHVVVFGRALPVKLSIGPEESQVIEMKVRPLLVDGKVKEFTTGDAHDVTDRTFVVRRAFRINDVLPDEPQKAPHWKWQR